MKLHGPSTLHLERIGEMVPLFNPTWVVPFREGYAFTTELGSWKTKRLARNHRVAVTPSDFRGRALVEPPPIKVKMN